VEILAHKLDAEQDASRIQHFKFPDSNIATVSIINEGKVKSEVFLF
jgi:hypothetical protein